jgi:hypothetical protein
MMKAGDIVACCAECGSIEIEVSAWTSQMTGEDTGTDGPTDQIWCAECETHDSDSHTLTAQEAEAINSTRREAALRKLQEYAPEIEQFTLYALVRPQNANVKRLRDRLLYNDGHALLFESEREAGVYRTAEHYTHDKIEPVTLEAKLASHTAKDATQPTAK